MNKMVILISKAGMADLERRAKDGDIDACCAMDVLEFRILSDNDAREFGL